jgi:uncharacterized protein (DUF2249 family)
MIISADTKIGTVITANPLAIDVLAAANSHFNKLKNPLLRKILAPRVTIAEAARIGNCPVDLILDSLAKIGFEISRKGSIAEHMAPPSSIAVDDIKYDVLMDVREELARGTDPFNTIMKRLKTLAAGETLLLINSFEPFPLIRILREKGYQISVKNLQPDIVHTYITKMEEGTLPASPDAMPATDEQLFEKVLQQYQGRFIETDVRALEMPQPMISILNSLDQLPENMALYVYHKKVPVFLLPELKERNFAYAVKPNDGGIIMIIFREGKQ